ncbi:MAG TPA: branched-chain amino acid ABC transporter substrate-binding protein [Vicinamibacterales bacterium]|nr:branched-chain amino acid ABC transporter substrate-binding protein [Vicinamibacterales bacterium]
MKIFRLTAILAAMLLVLAACQGGGGASPTGDGATEPPPPTGEESPIAGDGDGDAASACEEDEFGCATYGPDEPIRIASALSITGDTAFLGNDSNYGIQVAIQDRGQILGHDVELVEEDAGCGEAEDGQTAAVAIAADDTILAVIGTTCSRTAVPAIPVLAEAGMLMMSPSNTAISLTDPEHPDYPESGNEWFTRTAYSDFFQGDADARFACEELQISTAATIHDGSPYAEQLQQAFLDQFAERCDGQMTFQGSINVGDTDFRQLLTEIAGSNDGGAPDILFFPVFSPEGPLIAQQAQEVEGLEDTILMGADGLKDAGFIEAAGDIAEEVGMYFSGPLPPSGEAYEEFLTKYQDVSGEEVPIAPYHAHAYDAAMIFFDAIEAVAIEEDDGTIHVPRTAFRDQVRSLENYEGLTGTLACNEMGDCGDTSVEVAQLQDGRFVEVWTSDEPEQ